MWIAVLWVLKSPPEEGANDLSYHYYKSALLRKLHTSGSMGKLVLRLSSISGLE